MFKPTFYLVTIFFTTFCDKCPCIRTNLSRDGQNPESSKKKTCTVRSRAWAFFKAKKYSAHFLHFYVLKFLLCSTVNLFSYRQLSESIFSNCQSLSLSSFMTKLMIFRWNLGRISTESAILSNNEHGYDNIRLLGRLDIATNRLRDLASFQQKRSVYSSFKKSAKKVALQSKPISKGMRCDELSLPKKFSPFIRI